MRFSRIVLAFFAARRCFGIQATDDSLLAIQQQNTKGRVTGEFSDPHGAPPEYEFNIAGGMRPPPKPHHFWWRTTYCSKFVKIRVGGYDNEAPLAREIPDLAIRTLQ